MTNMKMTTAIAKGFMNGGLSMEEVLKVTVEFLGRKLTRNEAMAIVRAYNKNMENK